MLNTKAVGNKNSFKEADKPRFEKLLFELSTFQFSLKNIQKATEGLKDILTEFAGTPGCTLMFKDEYDYLWKIGEKTTLPFKVGSGIAGNAAKLKRILVVEDTRENPSYIRMKSKAYTSIVAVPIFGEQKKVLGILNFTYRKYDPSLIPPEKEMKIVAACLKTILENIVLYYKVERQKEDLKTRKVISSILENSSLTTRQKFDRVTKETSRFIEIQRAKIYTLDTDKKTLFAKDNKKIESMFLKVYKKTKKERSIIDIAYKNKRFLSAQPIVSKGKLAGFILMEDTLKNTNNFSTQERNLLRLVSMKIGIFIAQEESSKKIIDEKEKWRLIFHNVEDGIVLISKDQLIVEANQRAKEMLGVKNKSITKEDFFSLFKIVNPEVNSSFISLESIHSLELAGQKELSKKIDDFFKKGKKIQPKEYLIETSNGKFWTIINMNTAIKKWHSEYFGVMHIRDISKRKKLEQDKNEFMSMVSHELRTPLSAMKGFLSMTLSNDYGELNERQVGSLMKIEKSTDRMVNLVEDLLDVSRIELGRIYLTKEPVSILETSVSALQEIEEKIKAKNITVFLQNQNITAWIRDKREKNKPTCLENHIYVLGDHDRIRQIMQNLIDNAVKYSFEKSTITVNVAANNQVVEIRVQDNGVGIAKQDQAKLFKKFSRIHNPLSIQAGGTGLGLYITKKLIQAHSGSINITSKEDKGSIFVVKIPIAKQLPLI